MPARRPEEICSLFKEYMAAGDIESLLALYDPEVAFLNKSRQLRMGVQELREELMPFAATKARFDFEIKQIVQSGNIALMHTEWKVSSPQDMSVYAIEVARRQPDGMWCWLIGDPFTVNGNVGQESKAA